MTISWQYLTVLVVVLSIVYHFLNTRPQLPRYGITSDLRDFYLSNGVRIPTVGLGTAGQLNENVIEYAVISAGYQLVDTASTNAPWYKTEESIGKVTQKLGRKNLFITTKLYTDDHGYDDALRAFQESLNYLKTDYIDLYLIHFPHCTKESGCGGTWRESWRAIEKLYQDGKVRAIGVSNFNADQLTELLSLAKIVPHVVQNYFEPFHQDQKVVEFCNKNKIFYQAYSTLGGQYWNLQKNPVLTNSHIVKISERLGVLPAQVVLRWALQRHVGVLPRSKMEQRLAINHQLFHFELSNKDMELINDMDEILPTTIKKKK